ncbi:Arginase precursor [Sphingopyxis sp. LC81]|uniref:arginase family protein n=1 Tax=Sphingopyxis sp. LC81 TaxID=1502850 RepID=UPI00050EF01C|nr:arginase family protein [Sphingopyxis sp. LC81]KGB56130.1 Arginase precursor [Sphingopyxis sp. LC81]
MSRAFDLVLAYPQWQGSGRHEHLPRGAAAAAAVCAAFGPIAEVPISTERADGHGVQRWDAIFEQFGSAQAILAASGARRVLTAGGDCAVDIAVIDHLNRVHADLSVVWIDAHIDGNSPETSPSGSFHGMPVAALLGQAPPPMRALLGAPIDPARFRYFGIETGDEGDWAFQRAFDLATLDPGALPRGPVHVHFDLDVLDPAEFPYLAYTDGKLAIDDAVALVRRIATAGDLVGLTITEFAPADQDQAERGSRMIARLCAAALGQ